MDEIAERIVLNLEPAAGWNTHDTPTTLECAAIEMLMNGMDEEAVEETLHQVLSVLRDEYAG